MKQMKLHIFTLIYIFNEYLIYINIYIERINERINKFVFIKIGDKK